ncbi:MAG TPA: hypothetical protein VMV10_09615 [Pirellulales bacterium]|nr:hypothetical protein [Pirellulales bacterium]
MSQDYVPRSSYDAANERANSNHRRASDIEAEYHAFRREVEIDRAVNAPDILPDNRPHVIAYLMGQNARVVEGRTVVDGPNGMLLTPTERVQQMREAPDEWGGIVGERKKQEPTAHERLEAKFRDMDMDQYMKGRKCDPNFFDPPPPDQK